MREVIMQYSGEEEDSHGLERVGELIRCKDCRYYQDNNGGYPHTDCKWNGNETPDEDDFCSGAERKEECK